MGVSTHNIGLMYFGKIISTGQTMLNFVSAGNLLCGIGYGCAYTPPIQACLDWFPDKKGLGPIV